MGAILESEDLSPFADVDEAKADAMIEDAEALAFRAAPCLKTATDDGVLAAAKAILRGAVLRWHEQGTASYALQTQGPPGFPVDQSRQRRNSLWPTEIKDLQELCSAGPVGRQAFSIDTAPTCSTHLPWCSINFGADYCSCGADLTNGEYPLYEGGGLA